MIEQSCCYYIMQKFTRSVQHKNTVHASAAVIVVLQCTNTAALNYFAGLGDQIREWSLISSERSRSLELKKIILTFMVSWDTSYLYSKRRFRGETGSESSSQIFCFYLLSQKFYLWRWNNENCLSKENNAFFTKTKKYLNKLRRSLNFN